MNVFGRSGQELVRMSSTGADLCGRTSDAHESGAGYLPRNVAVQDCSFLFGILFLSGLSYVGRLGFYSDDWHWAAVLHSVKDQSLGGLLRLILSRQWYFERPVQMLYQAFMFLNFGLHPLPYHLSNTLVLAGAAVLFYATLRELQLPHCITLAVPLVYGLLPHFATDRFWIAAHQAGLSQAFFFLGLYAALRAVRGGRGCSLCLKTVSILSFSLALLSYEVITPLLPASLLLIGYRMYTKRGGSGHKPHALIFPGLGFLLLAAACLGLILLYKVQVSERASSSLQNLAIGEVVRNGVDETIRFNLFRYGAGLPRTAFALYRFAGAGGWLAIIAGIIGISVLLYLNWTFKRSQSALLSKNGALCLFAAGFVVFVLDYVALTVLMGSQLKFTIDGIDNRVTIAAAIGTAGVLVGGTMLLILAVVPAKLQSLTFCGAIAAICVMNFICVASFAECWARAYPAT